MKIALIQQHATRNKQDNLERGLKALAQATANGSQLVSYAELGLEYFYPQSPAKEGYKNFAEPIPGPTTDLFCKKAKELGVVIVLNLYERAGENTYDSSPVIDADGSILGTTRMMHIMEGPCFHEQGYYTPGDSGIAVYQTKAGKIGVAICYDRHYPEYMRILALKGAELVVIPQAGSVGEWPEGLFEAEVQVAAFQNGYFAALTNRVGKEDCLTFAGESFMVNPMGQVIARAPSDSDHILYAELDFSLNQKCSAKQHFLVDRRPQLYEGLGTGG